MAKSDKPKELTPTKIKAYKARLSGVMGEAESALTRANLNIEQAWTDIAFCVEHPIATPKLPVGMARSLDAVKALEHIQKRRNKLTGMRIACIRAKHEIEPVITRARSYLILQPSIRDLKNDSQRNAAIQRVLGNVENCQIAIKGLLEAIDGLLWNIKDNQHAMELAYKEIAWLQKSE
jgi:hypothetical protein